MVTEMFDRHLFEFITFCSVYLSERNEGKTHVNDDTHAMHVTKGRGFLNVRGEVYPIERGSVMMIPPFTQFSLRLAPDYAMLNFHFKLCFPDGVSMEDRLRFPYVFFPEKFDKIEERLKTLDRIKRSENFVSLRSAPIAHEIIAGYLVEQASHMVFMPLPNTSIDQARKRLESPNVTVFDSTALAHLCCLSKSQMNRKFRDTLGVSPKAYWERFRFYHVRAALRDTDAPLSEIAEARGFADQSHLSRWFKTISGVSPRTYRRKTRDFIF